VPKVMCRKSLTPTPTSPHLLAPLPSLLQAAVRLAHLGTPPEEVHHTRPLLLLVLHTG
jgi:hypothetical protein